MGRSLQPGGAVVQHPGTDESLVRERGAGADRGVAG